MNILLIGGNGFVGKSLINEAILSNYSVSYLSRNKIKSDYSPHVNWIEGDIFSLDKIHIKEKFDIAIHLIGTIRDKTLLKKLNTKSVEQTISLCNKFKIKKIVFLSAKGGFKNYLNSKKEAEKLIINSNLDYLIVKPGLMYGKNKISSYFNIFPIKMLSSLGIKFFKNVYPLPVDHVAKKIFSTIIFNPNAKYLNLDDMK
ncbi:NAD(P)H-binding protein [Gemella cuniculi]|uniref:NAD(P)H-binding protein n=1 Tax=Gemella cuniculi TaxID=150240 RepID=UPI00040FC502|nr:NAD(P)H-binding protein [Gemella cuniculi]